jgi:hypothetical protein
MYVLIASAAVLAAILVGMGFYINSHPPDASAKGVLWLQRGLRLGAVSATAVLLLLIAIRYFQLSSPSLFWPLMVCALVGSILNIVSLGYCLRERNAESLCAACFVLLNQLLWILYAIRAMPEF